MAKPLKKGRAWWMGRGGNGLRVRLRPVPGETSRRTLRNPLRFPCVMRGFGWSEEFGHSKFRTINGGEFSQPTPGRTLRVIDETETMMLAYDPQWLTVRGINPRTVHETLLRIGREKEPVQLMAKLEGAKNPLIRMPISLLGMSVVMREGEPDTLYYMVRFEEWRQLGTGRRSKGRFPLNHYIDGDDTLHSLARKYYRSTQNWHAIAKRNSIHGWGQNSPLVKMKRFKLGSKLVIPEPPSGGEWLGPTFKPGRENPKDVGTIEDLLD